MKVEPASSIEVNNKIYEKKMSGKDIITLSLGESFFKLPAFNMVLDDDVNHYIETAGYPPLIKKIVEYYNSFEAHISEKNVQITAGAKLGIYEAMLALRNKKNRFENIGFFEPAWVSYSQQIIMIGGNPIPYDLSLIDKLEAINFAELDCLIINNPHNPTGLIIGEETISALINKCRENNVCIIFDEVYSEFTDDKFFSSALWVESYDDLELIVVNSLSKNFGLSGWRVGYCISKPQLMKDLRIIHQHLLTCASVPLQKLLSENFDEIVRVTRPQIKKVVGKRARVVKYLEEKGFDVMPGSSTFYIFCSHPLLSDSDYNFDSFLEAGVAFVPGAGYGAAYKNHLRLSVGVESIERIRKAIDIMYSIIKKRNSHLSNRS